MKRFLRHRLAVLGSILLAVLVLSALVGPALSSQAANEQDLFSIAQPPSSAHWMGTDDLGRDLFARLLAGGRVSLAVGLLSSLIATLIGTAVGAIAGFFSGNIDNLLMRLVDLMLAFPAIFLQLILFSVVGPSLWTVIFFLGAFGWMYLARVVRGEILSLREKNFVEASRALGVSSLRLILRHLLPNVLGAIIVSTTLSVAFNLLSEGTLSFLGFGVPASTPTWGNILFSAASYMRQVPTFVIFPGLFLTLAVLAVNFIGDGLRDTLDPRGN